MLLQDGATVTVQPASRAALENLAIAQDLLLLFTTCFCSYFYPEAVAQCSTKLPVVISKDHECHLTEGEINRRVSHRNLSSLCSNHQLIPELFWIWKIQAWLFRTQRAALEWRRSLCCEKKNSSLIKKIISICSWNNFLSTQRELRA